LREASVDEVVMAGPVKRPTLAQLRPDWRAARVIARIGIRALTDDGMLSSAIKEFESEGFRVVGIHDVLDGLLTRKGPLGAVLPDAQAEADIALGIEVARALGSLDVGQAAVVQQGIVLGVEAIEGTDALLARVGMLRREGVGGVLVKVAKPQQERRADLPTIGVGTVEGAARAGLRGIAAQANASLVIDGAAVAAAADRLGLFVVGVDLG
jgi:UDP-2,3-diacylglucosamine hydrolase